MMAILVWTHLTKSVSTLTVKQASISGAVAVFKEAEKWKNCFLEFGAQTAICCKGVMPKDVAWSYLNISIHHLADEKLTSNQQNQKSTVFLFSKAAWRKSSS